MIPHFKTERLILRDVQLSDIPSYQKHFNNWNIIRNLSAGVPWPYPSDGAEFFVKNVLIPNQNKNMWSWGIFLASHPQELIGVVDLFKNDRPENRGFWLSEEHWGKGLMTEAVAPVTKFAFEELGFEKLIFSNALGNLRSRRIKEKTGATFFKIVPSQHVDVELNESELWELTKDNWLKHASL